MNDENISAESIMEMARAYQKSRILLTAIELDIFHLIARGIDTAGKIGKWLSADERGIERLLNALTVMKMLSRQENSFQNIQEISRFLDSSSPEFIWGLRHTANGWERWGTLTAAVLKGRSVIDVAIGPARLDRIESFIAAMHHRGKQNASDLVRAVNIAKLKHMIDIGGGSGIYAMAFVNEGKVARATVFDRPEVVDLTRKYIDEAGLSGKIDTLAGDYLADEFGSAYDLALLSAIIHINSPEENQDLINRTVGSMVQGGTVIIQDFFVDESRTSPALAVIFSLNMLVGTANGDVYTEGEVTLWMSKAGLKNITRIDCSPQQSFLIGQKM